MVLYVYVQSHKQACDTDSVCRFSVTFKSHCTSVYMRTLTRRLKMSGGVILWESKSSWMWCLLLMYNNTLFVEMVLSHSSVARVQLVSVACVKRHLKSDAICLAVYVRRARLRYLCVLQVSMSVYMCIYTSTNIVMYEYV